MFCKSGPRNLSPNTFSLTTYYVNCLLMLRVCNMWQFRQYLFFLFLFLCIYCIYSFLVCCRLTWWIKLTIMTAVCKVKRDQPLPLWFSSYSCNGRENLGISGTGWKSFLSFIQQCQSTEGNKKNWLHSLILYSSTTGLMKKRRCSPYVSHQINYQ